MRELLRRSFRVDAPPAVVWDRLTDLPSWPEWARHIRRVDSAGPPTMGAPARLRLKNGTAARVTTTRLEPGRSFYWEGKLAWMDLGYDHVVESDGSGSKVTFVLEGGGFGVGSLGRVFAAIYARNLDRAIERFRDLAVRRSP